LLLYWELLALLLRYCCFAHVYICLQLFALTLDVAAGQRRLQLSLRALRSFTAQFTCFTNTKDVAAAIATQLSLRALRIFAYFVSICTFVLVKQVRLYS